MDGTAYRSSFRDLVDDRVDEGVFRVDRSIYTDQAVFEAEIERIFEGGWVFLCHEGQVENPGRLLLHRNRPPAGFRHAPEGRLARAASSMRVRIAARC